MKPTTSPIEHTGHGLVEFARHHPLLLKGALIAGGVILAIGATRFAARKLGVID